MLETEFEIKRKACMVTINGRKFRLEEMSAEETEEWLEKSVSLSQQILKEAMEQARRSEADPDNFRPLTVEQISRKVIRDDVTMVTALLCSPQDDKPQPDQAWVKKLGSHQLSAILARQDELNNVEALLKNGYSLLIAAQKEMQEAMGIKADRADQLQSQPRQSTESTPSSPGPDPVDASAATSESSDP